MTSRKLTIIIFLIVLLEYVYAIPCNLKINLSHLNELYDPISGGWWEFWSNGRVLGRVNLDDTARAGITYLNYYLIFNDSEALKMAERAIRFTMKMQTERGDFYLYLEDNKRWTPRDPGVGDWYGRAVHELGLGYLVFSRVNKTFANEIKECLMKALNNVDRTDALFTISHIVMGLSYYYMGSGDESIKTTIRKLADKIVVKQAYVNSTVDWYPPWSYFEVKATYAPGLPIQALVMAGVTLNESRYIESAKSAAQGFPLHLAIAYDCTYSTYLWRHRPKQFCCPPIIPATICKAYSLLANATEGKESEAYSILAGLYASWFMGNNPANTPMYNEETGIVRDGICGPHEINWNSGAEATEVPLDALLYIYRNNVSCSIIRGRDLYSVKPLFIESEDLETNGKKLFSEIYSGGKAVYLEKGKYISFNLKPNTEGTWEIVLLAKGNARVKLEAPSIGSTVRDVSSGSLRFIPLHQLHVSNDISGTLKISIEEGDLAIDAVLIIPSIEYKVFKVAEDNIIVIGLKLFDSLNHTIVVEAENSVTKIAFSTKDNTVHISSNESIVNISIPCQLENNKAIIGNYTIFSPFSIKLKSGLKINLYCFPLKIIPIEEHKEDKEDYLSYIIITVITLVIVLLYAIYRLRAMR